MPVPPCLAERHGGRSLQVLTWTAEIEGLWASRGARGGLGAEDLVVGLAGAQERDGVEADYVVEAHHAGPEKGGQARFRAPSFVRSTGQ